MSSSDKENDSRPSSSLHGNINNSESQKVPGESFQYRTLNGRVIKSVIPPGKGIKVDYKVSRFTCSLFMCFPFVKRNRFYMMFYWLPTFKVQLLISYFFLIFRLRPISRRLSRSLIKRLRPSVAHH